MSDAPTTKQPQNDPSSSATAPDLEARLATEANAPTVHTPTRLMKFTMAVGQRFGEYEILAEIARGGMGIVYRARQTTLDRIVALKMILAGRLADADDVARFQTEAAAAAKLQHPNIVAVHDVGDYDGQHFFTMDYIEGISLDHKLSKGPLSCKAAARYVRILARAVQYAHKQGILHRDLKPSNILLDAEDEPHITDFGLAKRLGPANSGQTRSGAILGTPSYMSPEQAQGKGNELGPASDIYSLGAILYELITGRPPFRAATPLDTVMQVIGDQPAPPRLLNPKIDHDLETICMKCLEKEPTMRYSCAEDLGEDLQRYLDGDSVHARSFNMIDRLAHVLERDTRTADFSAWSSMVLLMAVGVGLEHCAVFALVWAEQPRVFVMVARCLLFAFLGALFWSHRGSQLLPRSAAERELWTIWIGYFTTYFSIVIVTRLLVSFEIVQSNPAWKAQHYFAELLPYPFISMVSGLAFFIMGSNYWGRCYAIGAAFFLAGPLMPLAMTWSPLIFGVMWATVLVMLGLHLRSQGGSVDGAPPRENQSSQAPTVQYKDNKAQG